MMREIVFTPAEAGAILRAGLEKSERLDGELQRIKDIDGKFPDNLKLADGIMSEKETLKDAMRKIWLSSS